MHRQVQTGIAYPRVQGVQRVIIFGLACSIYRDQNASCSRRFDSLLHFYRWLLWPRHHGSREAHRTCSWRSRECSACQRQQNAMHPHRLFFVRPPALLRWLRDKRTFGLQRAHPPPPPPRPTIAPAFTSMGRYEMYCCTQRPSIRNRHCLCTGVWTTPVQHQQLVHVAGVRSTIGQGNKPAALSCELASKNRPPSLKNDAVTLPSHLPVTHFGGAAAVDPFSCLLQPSRRSAIPVATT